jgi:hypothetical protein
MTSEDAKGSIIPFDFGDDDDDGFDLVATPTTATSHAKRMVFKQGLYLRGPDKEVVPIGTRFVVVKANDGWQHWVDGRVVQRIPREPGKRFPIREELGDTDQSQWSVFNGEPSDPWQLQSELLMVEEETGQLTILQVTSWSAREQIEDFCRLVTSRRRQLGVNAKPIIALSVVTRSRVKGGFYKAPAFPIAGWIGAREADPTVAPLDGGSKPVEPGAAAVPEPSQLAKNLAEHLQAHSPSGTETSAAPKRRPRHKKPEVPPWQDDNDLDDVIPY